MQEQNEGQVERQRRAWRKAQDARAKARRAKHEGAARTCVHDLVSLALRIADYRQRTDLPVPKKEFHDWVALFVAADTSLCQPDSGVPSTGDGVMDAAAVHDYLHCVGEWAGEQGAGFNSELGQAVHAVRVRAQQPPKMQDAELTVPVRVAIVGGPFTGKTTLAQSLAEANRAALLEPEALISAAIAAAEAYVTPEPQVRHVTVMLHRLDSGPTNSSKVHP